MLLMALKLLLQICDLARLLLIIRHQLIDPTLFGQLVLHHNSLHLLKSLPQVNLIFPSLIATLIVTTASNELHKVLELGLHLVLFVIEHIEHFIGFFQELLLLG